MALGDGHPTLIPTAEMVGPPGRLMVNESDVERYRQRGYHLAGEVQAEPEPNPDAGDGAGTESETPPKIEIPDDLYTLKVPELKELADALGIEGADNMKKDDLVYAIGVKRP